MNQNIRRPKEETLDKIESVFNEFTSFHSMLIERGVKKTKYGKDLDDIARPLKSIYSTAKAKHRAFLLNKHLFEAGRLERDAFERSLIRLQQEIFELEVDISIKVVPHLRNMERTILQKDILMKVKSLNLPDKEKKVIKEEAKKIQDQMTLAEEKGAVDEKVKEYIDVGKRIVKLGRKIWEIIKEIAPASLPLILRIFRVGG